MRAYQKRKQYAEPDKNASAPTPLDSAQLNLLLRHAFAWLWVGMGISATVAGAMRAHPIAPDLTITIVVLVAQFGLAFALSRVLPRFTPKQAASAFVFYAALTGFTLSAISSMLYHPKVSDVVVTACVSTAGLFGLMTLIGWRTRLDFCRARSFVLMTLLGLALAFLANKLAAAAAWEYVFSFFSVLLFSALASDHQKRTAALASTPDLRIQPTDSLRFSILLALELYVDACKVFVVAVYSSMARRSWDNRRYNHHMARHHQSHYSGIGIGSASGGFGSGGGRRWHGRRRRWHGRWRRQHRRRRRRRILHALSRQPAAQS